jgi:hypothetical protein
MTQGLAPSSQRGTYSKLRASGQVFFDAAAVESLQQERDQLAAKLEDVQHTVETQQEVSRLIGNLIAIRMHGQGTFSRRHGTSGVEQAICYLTLLSGGRPAS